ncbi:hypothetical protein CHX26_06315 [Porphyrobacter sp. HT-58-2]|nr:hypothetical protein CHX26_06315 [Porphyrobacter sp. HT-58-2]
MTVIQFRSVLGKFQIGDQIAIIGFQAQKYETDRDSYRYQGLSLEFMQSRKPPCLTREFRRETSRIARSFANGHVICR